MNCHCDWPYSGCTVAGSFIAFGVLRMRGVLGKEGWRSVSFIRRAAMMFGLTDYSCNSYNEYARWLFLVEGTLTLLIGIATFFKMPPGPTQTKTWYRPKGWFTERQEIIAVTRVLRDDPTKGDMHNRQALTLKLLWNALLDYDLWPLYIVWVSLAFGEPFTADIEALQRPFVRYSCQPTRPIPDSFFARSWVCFSSFPVPY